MRPVDEQQCQTAVQLGLISAETASECRALFDPDRHQDFAAYLLGNGHIAAEAAQRIRSACATTGVAPRIPGYGALEEIGRGGMGVVYRARHLLLERLDAIKVLAPELAGDAEFIQRFLAEARAAARLSHPNVVRIFDAREVGKSHYLAMEYVDGPALAALLEREGKVAVERAARLFAPVARALDHVHKAGIVHRDVKPSNILLTAEEVPKLADLGLAKSPPALTAGASTSTTGAIRGTFLYMPPEQARSFKSADARSDIYALGCTLYHALVGRPPFMGETPYDVLRQHETAAPDYLQNDNEYLTGDVRRLVGRMLAKSPGNRPRSAVEVAEALEAFTGVVRQASGVGEGPRLRVPDARRPTPDASARFVQVLHGFETRRDLERVTLNNPDCPVDLSLTRKGATEGERALLAKFPAAKGPERPAFHLLDFRHDWAKYRTFALDLHNPQRDVVLVRVTILDRLDGKFERTLELAAGANRLEWAVADVADEIDVRNLRRIRFALAQEEAAEVSLDNLRLEGEAEEGKAVNTAPDLIVVGPGAGADYADFAPAYLAAQTSDIIEIRSDETYELKEPLILGWHPDGRHIDRDVHIRAGIGCVPTLTAEVRGWVAPDSLLSVEGALALEGLRLVGKADATYGENYAYFFGGARGDLHLSRCYLRCARIQWARGPTRKAGEMSIDECFIEDSWIKRMDCSHSVRIASSVFWKCQPAFQVSVGEAEGTPDIRWAWGVLAEQCTYHSVSYGVTVNFYDAAAGRPLSQRSTFRGVHCAFAHVLSISGIAGVSLLHRNPFHRRVDDVNGYQDVKAHITFSQTSGAPVEVISGPYDDDADDLGFRDPEHGDFRLRPDSVLLQTRKPLSSGEFVIVPERRGAPDHVAYPDFLYDLARRERESAAGDAGATESGRQTV